MVQEKYRALFLMSHYNPSFRIGWCYNHVTKKTAQSVNTLLWFSWHNRSLLQQYDQLKCFLQEINSVFNIDRLEWIICIYVKSFWKVPGHPYSSIRKQIAFSHATGQMRTNFATKGNKKALVTTSCSLKLPSNICEKKIRLEINYHALLLYNSSLLQFFWFPL